MDWKQWYMELEQDDESWDVSEEIVLRGVVQLNFCGQPSEVEVEFIVGADSEEQAQTIEEPTQLQKRHGSSIWNIHQLFILKCWNPYTIIMLASWKSIGMLTVHGERTRMNMRLMWSGRNNC